MLTLHTLVMAQAHQLHANKSIKTDIFASIDSELSGYQCDVTDLKTKTMSGCDYRHLKSRMMEVGIPFLITPEPAVPYSFRGFRCSEAQATKVICKPESIQKR